MVSLIGTCPQKKKHLNFTTPLMPKSLRQVCLQQYLQEKLNTP